MTTLLEPVWNGEPALERIYAPASEGSDDGEAKAKQKLLALGYEVTRSQEAIVDGQPVVWEERLLVVYSPSQAKQARRGLAQRLERDFRRLKGRPLGIHPLYVQREDHARAIVRLLSLALRVLTLVEHVVRERLRATGETLRGLYAGNPRRETARPTTERLLKAFRGITLTVVHLPDQTIRHVTPLSQLQQRILDLLGLSDSIYENLALWVDPIPP